MIFSQGGGGGVSTPYQHPVAMYAFKDCLDDDVTASGSDFILVSLYHMHCEL
jgi:hypothetical protein